MSWSWEPFFIRAHSDSERSELRKRIEFASRRRNSHGTGHCTGRCTGHWAGAAGGTLGGGESPEVRRRTEGRSQWWQQVFFPCSLSLSHA